MIKSTVLVLENKNKRFSDVVKEIIRVFDSKHVYISDKVPLTGARKEYFDRAYNPEELDEIYKRIMVEVLKKKFLKTGNE